MKDYTGPVIYGIENKVNGKLYVGSSINFKMRISIHLRSFRSGKHGNEHMQRAFNMYGEKSFEFKIMQYVSNKENLLECEQRYIDFFNPEYNICKKAGSRLGLTTSEETKKKIGLANKGKPNAKKGIKLSPETIEKMRKAKMGHVVSEETRNKLRGRKLSPEAIAKRSETLKSRGGYKWSENTRAIMKEKMTGKKFPNRPKQSLEQIEKRRIKLIGRKYPNRKPQPLEANEKRRQSLIKNWRNAVDSAENKRNAVNFSGR